MHNVSIQHLQHGLKRITTRHVVVEGCWSVSAAEEVVGLVTTLGEVGEGVGWGVAATELVLALGGEGEVRVVVVARASARGGGTGEMVAVEHEVAEGFTGNFATLHHHVEVH